ncbi:hypothetical protein Tco_0052875 [Tanacetum coccineum]
MFGKVSYFEDIKYFKDFEIEFPAIIYKDALTSKSDVSPEPTDIHQAGAYRLQVLDFGTLTVEMDHAITDRLRMDHTWVDGQVEFASRAWRKLFEIRKPLVRELILEIFSKCKIAQGVLTAESSRVMDSKADLSNYCNGISSARDFLTMFPSYTAIKEPLRRLCHRLIAFTARRGQALKKVTTTDLYYLKRMYEGTVNVPYMLAQYLFRHTEGRKEGDKMSRGHFITRLAEHFSWLDYGSADYEITEEGVQDDPTPIQATQAPLAAPSSRTVSQRLLRLEEEVHGLRDSIREQQVRWEISWQLSCIIQEAESSTEDRW